ncbi:hypothetical protein YTPLAS18_20530 [Nitrospira sp.]|nr:hypothetical protein YTPLAS18_20530 [Nitrospira sp.]
MTLIQADLIPGSGDQLITYDTDTNFQWLNLTATANRSVNEVLAGFGGFTTTYGFRYATGAEVGELFRHAGISKGLTEPPFVLTPTTEPNHIGIEILQDLMNGKSFLATGTAVRTYGMYNGGGWWRRYLHLGILNHVNSRTEVLPIQPPNILDRRSVDTGSYLMKVSPLPLLASRTRSRMKQPKGSKKTRGRK